MEPKKNTQFDVHRHRGVFLNIGLIVSLILMIMAFKWTQPLNEIVDRKPVDTGVENIALEDPRITAFKKEPDPQPRKITPVVPIALTFREIENVVEVAEHKEAIDMNDYIERIEVPVVVEPETIEIDTFRIVETMPTPLNGWPAFYETLSKKIKYPKQAQRMGTKGKVYVEFNVNKQGKLSHFKIIKGIGHGCDEEAQRVLAMTEWAPGKQRGKPVNVRLVQPITFNISY